MDCFLCKPDGGRSPETPWNWSLPRALCPRHKLPARLEDGQRLSEALQRVRRDDAAVEGSLLGWIFNPVFLDAENHGSVRGWSDFAAGGMAIVEDRFTAGSYFEFRACEVARAVDLLHVLRVADRPLSTLGEVVTVAGAAEEAAPRDAPIRTPLRGPSAGLEDLIRTWSFERELARLRQSLGRRWPVSGEDLDVWIDRCAALAVASAMESETAFVRALLDLAARRFPTGPLI